VVGIEADVDGDDLFGERARHRHALKGHVVELVDGHDADRVDLPRFGRDLRRLLTLGVDIVAVDGEEEAHRARDDDHDDQALGKLGYRGDQEDDEGHGHADRVEGQAVVPALLPALQPAHHHPRLREGEGQEDPIAYSGMSRETSPWKMKMRRQEKRASMMIPLLYASRSPSRRNW